MNTSSHIAEFLNRFGSLPSEQRFPEPPNDEPDPTQSIGPIPKNLFQADTSTLAQMILEAKKSPTPPPGVDPQTFNTVIQLLVNKNDAHKKGKDAILRIVANHVGKVAPAPRPMLPLFQQQHALSNGDTPVAPIVFPQ